jgi:kelch-like protein 10
MATQFFRREVALHPLVRDNELVGLVDKYQADPNTASNPSFALPRNPLEVLLTFGGWSEGSAVVTVSIHNPVTASWQEAELELPVSWAYMEAVYLAGSVYLVGGRASLDELRTHRQLWRLDLGCLTWHQLNCLSVGRNYVSAVLLDGSIYAIGGNNGRTRLNSVERYDVAANQWFPVPNMRWMRSDATAVVLDGSIYVMGGFDGFAPTHSVEEYNPANKRWSMVRPMQEKRSGLKAVAWRSRIYVVGGWDGTNRLSSCEMYDPTTRRWTQLASMKTARSNHSLAVVDDRLVVAGGYDGTSTTAQAESYHWETNTWSPLSPLPAKRSALSCCTAPLAALGTKLRERLVSRANSPLGPPTNPEQGGGHEAHHEEMEGMEADPEFEMFEESDSDEEAGYMGHNFPYESDED